MASLRGIGRRVADFGRGFVDTFLRDNKLLPPILALLALFVFAWVLAGAFVGGTGDQKSVAHRSEVAQADGGGSNPPAPQVENRDVNSYSAYRSKDPFRQVFAVVGTTPEGTTTTPAEQTTTGPGKPKGGAAAGGGKNRPGGGGGGRGGRPGRGGGLLNSGGTLAPPP